MNTHLPTPTPDCVTYTPLLPLLAHGLLEDTEAEDVRAHLAACAYCQALAALDDELDAAVRRRFLPADDAEIVVFSTQQLLQMLDRRPETELAPAAARSVITPRPRRMLRLALVSAAAAVLLVCSVGAELSSRSPGRLGGSQGGQTTAQAQPTVGSSIDDLTRFGAQIDADLDQITADQQAAATDNAQQDQVQP